MEAAGRREFAGNTRKVEYRELIPTSLEGGMEEGVLSTSLASFSRLCEDPTAFPKVCNLY